MEINNDNNNDDNENDNEKNTDKFLIFPGLEITHIYILIFLVSTLLRVVIPNLVESTFAGVKNMEEKNYYKQICFFDMLNNFIGDFSVGIYMLLKLFKKKQKTKITTSAVQTKKGMLRKFFIYLPLIALIDTLAQLCLFSFSYIDSKDYILGIGKKEKIIHDEDLFFVVIIDIMVRYIFSKILLQSYFYKHHYLSMILNAIGSIPLFIINIKDLIHNYSNRTVPATLSTFSIFLILYIVRTVLYSLEDVYNKIALKKLLLRPYELMFYKAAFEIIPIIIVSTISLNDSNFSNYAKDNLRGIHCLSRLFYRLCFIVCNIFRTISLITIIEKISPDHLSILKSMEFIGLFVYFLLTQKIWNNDIVNIIFASISCIILLVGALIHNEMIIINKWGFYECTNYYKSEIKSQNVDVNFDEKTKTHESSSLLGESSQED